MYTKYAYSDNNHGQPHSILNIFLTFVSSLYFMAYFRSDIEIIGFFVGRDEN